MAIKVHPSLHVHPGPWLRRQIVGPHDLAQARAHQDEIKVTRLEYAA